MGWRRLAVTTVKHAAHYVRYCRQPGYMPFFLFSFGGRRNWRSTYKYFVRGREPLLRVRGMIGSCSVYGEAPMREFHSNPIAVSASGRTGKPINSFDACHPYAKKDASRAVLGRMQLTLHATRRTPHGGWRLVLQLVAMSAWSR